MSLISLHTNLKSLKYGNDRSGGGNSNQPYVTTPIPDGKEIFNIPTGDFIVRGGYLSVKNTTEDVLRFTRYFHDPKNPSGFLFAVKQNLLSRLAARTQASTGLLNNGIYTPLSTLAQISVEASGLHFNKQGLNPFPDTPLSLKTYSDSVEPQIPIFPSIKDSNNNRLVLLSKNKIYNQPMLSPLPFLRNDISLLPNQILSYQGGPGAPLGIGSTKIRFADQRTNTYIKEKYNTEYYKQNIDLLDVEQLLEQSDGLIGTSKPDFREILRKKLPSKSSTILSNAPFYELGEGKTIENRVHLGDPGNKFGKNLYSYTNGTGKGALDKINAKSLYQSETVSKEETNDLVKFRIEVINNDEPKKSTYIHFRAFLNSINDSYDADWNSTQYVGRGEKFYNYTGFDRKVSLSWTVAAQSKEELIPMYKKLNYLASTLAPDYSHGGYMRGNIVKLTIGGYFFEQPGIITSLNYEISEDSTWEIGINDVAGDDSSVKELPHIIKVSSFNFIPIHNFVPRLQQNLYDKPEDGGNIDPFGYGYERFIALSNGKGNNNTNY